MRIGIVSPVVIRLPGRAGDWEEATGIEGLARIAETADRLGYHHLTCSEHVAVPEPVAEVRGGTYWDPLSTLGYLAARTTGIKLATRVVVLGYHHPLELVKRYGTLDRISGGRLVLGVGVGSLEEEFDLLGAEFAGRGARADDAMRALRAAFGVRVPSYAGEHYRFGGMVVEPTAVQRSVPMWVGGKSFRSLRRAVELGDGWVPVGLAVDELTAMLARVERPDGFEVVLSAGRPLDPLGHRDDVATVLDRLAGAGATIIGAHVWAGSVEHYCEQLHALKELADAAEDLR
jgi:probable F420-dependent oxidoreductase